MCKVYIAILSMVVAAWNPSASSGQSVRQHLLPPASDFRLIMREDLHSKLPFGPSCRGEARHALPCRAFVFTLKNTGKRTVHLSGNSCAQPAVTISRKLSDSDNEWSVITEPASSSCVGISYTDVRLRPGESAHYSTRLISPRRQFQNGEIWSVGPGSYTLRAEWTLKGCVDAQGGVDCLIPMQIIRRGDLGGGSVENQDPLTLYSNEVVVKSPELPNLGDMKFSLEVMPHRLEPTAAKADPLSPGCTEETNDDVSCTSFHYTFRYLGDRPIRIGWMTCDGIGIWPEYRTDASDWKHPELLKPKPPIMIPGNPKKEFVFLHVCGRNFYSDQVIFPRGVLGGALPLAGLLAEYDTTPLSNAPRYQIRFILRPHVCFASPDGSFCLLPPNDQPDVVSNEVTVERRSGTAPFSPQ